MVDEPNAHIELPELKALLEAADPAAVFTPPRLLRRIIKQHRKLPGIGLQVPHRKTYVIDREALLGIVDQAQLGLKRLLPVTVILISQPDPDRLAELSRNEALVKYWRLLFHSRVHLALDERIRQSKLSQADVRERIERIGQTAFDEIHVVLEQEKFLLPPKDDRSVYIEFVALFLDLGYFAPALIPSYFPSLCDRRDIDSIVAADIDGQAVLSGSRLHGAPGPASLAVKDTEAAGAPAAEEGGLSISGEYRESSYRRLLGKADRASARANTIRAAILRRRAAAAGGPELGEKTRAEAQTELMHLADRLRPALALSESEVEEWRQALLPLLDPASRPMWPVEARLLYDLQKVCTEHERETYALDIVGWIVSLGKLPVKRLLPNHRAVLVARHLRSAIHRLSAARIAEGNRRSLAGLLHDAVERSETRLRARLRPLVTETLDKVHLEAQNLPERVARNKLVEELLDQVVERGFVTIGDLRDAISRNNLKLPDLANADEFFLGDRLIRTNRRLAVAWDGVYRRAEIYLRWLQRLSSLAFATRPGRFLTSYLVVPYGVAYVALEGALHLIHLFSRWGGGHHLRLTSRETVFSVLVLGTFLFALLHVASFRRGALRALKSSFLAFRAVLVDAPALLLRLPLVRRVLESDGFALFRNFVLKPLAVTGVTALVYPLYGVGKRPALVSSGAIFVVACLLLNSRLGRMIEESITDAFAKTWLRFRMDVFPAIFAFTMSLFRGLIEAVERVIYTVDEWLRFRTGQSRLILVAKAALAFVWFFVTYVIRIYVNLFVEPTVNPIKHFPVVTVSAKLIVPFVLTHFYLFEAPFLPLGPAVARAMAMLNVILLPGIFGFLVWELKENWRLYEANRSKVLRPVLIGHHGETMSRLLRPGFHSGTIPNLYTKLRRAERRAHRIGMHASSGKYREALDHVEERVRHFCEREFLALLHGSKDWNHAPVEAGKINISSNRIALEFPAASGADESAWIAFEERSGWLVAGIACAGWLTKLSTRQLAAWSTALAGLYKLASVDLVREQIEASFKSGSVALDFRPDGLVVWPESRRDTEVFYPLRDGKAAVPLVHGGNHAIDFPTLCVEKLLFKNMPIFWKRWVELWEADQAGKGIPTPAVEGLLLIPDRPRLARAARC